MPNRPCWIITSNGEVIRDQVVTKALQTSQSLSHQKPRGCMTSPCRGRASRVSSWLSRSALLCSMSRRISPLTRHSRGFERMRIGNQVHSCLILNPSVTTRGSFHLLGTASMRHSYLSMRSSQALYGMKSVNVWMNRLIWMAKSKEIPEIDLIGSTRAIMCEFWVQYFQRLK